MVSNEFIDKCPRFRDDWAIRHFLHPKLLRKSREVRVQLEYLFAHCRSLDHGQHILNVIRCIPTALLFISSRVSITTRVLYDLPSDRQFVLSVIIPLTLYQSINQRHATCYRPRCLVRSFCGIPPCLHALYCLSRNLNFQIPSDLMCAFTDLLFCLRYPTS
jgi:hypothetical protein